MSTATIEILDPRQDVRHEKRKLNPGCALAGAMVGYRHVEGWTNFVPFLETIDKGLKERRQIRNSEWVILNGVRAHFSAEIADQFAAKIQAAVVGLGT